MGVWTEAIEMKARIIHSQLATAVAVANRAGLDVAEVERPYLALLSSLYQEEFAFARVADVADLIARFSGPLLNRESPTMSVVMNVLAQLRDQVRNIAKSIVGLSSSESVRWPGHLDPQVAGLASGSLVVGISVPTAEEMAILQQGELTGMSDVVLDSVRSAVRSLSRVSKHLEKDRLLDSIATEFPDPAVRDTVIVAASRLAPSGRGPIESVSLMSPDSTSDESPPLTRAARKTLNSALAHPVKSKLRGKFEGVVREIDLDAHRFEIRFVKSIGAIRCAYDPKDHAKAKRALDARIKILGTYEVLADQRPRMMFAESFDILEEAPKQPSLELP